MERRKNNGKKDPPQGFARRPLTFCVFISDITVLDCLIFAHIVSFKPHFFAPESRHKARNEQERPANCFTIVIVVWVDIVPIPAPSFENKLESCINYVRKFCTAARKVQRVLKEF